MLVHGAGNIGLVDQAQQVLERDRQQAGFGPRQKAHHGIKIVAVDGVMTQHLAQHGQCMPPRVVAFAGIDPERPFQLKIAEGAPARISRQIVGVEGDKSVRRIIVDVAKRAVIVALEHHHLIRPDAPIGHLLAKAFRHGAEIFADHHASMLRAFLCGRRQQRLEGHLHIDAVVGGKAVRHQIKPLQAKHMIEPDRAGIAHRRPQHFPIRPEGLDFKTGGVEAGEAPILTGGIKCIRWRAHREMAGNRDLLVPGIEPVGLHADRQIEVETDLHAQPGGEIPASLQLLIGRPLHEFDELDLDRIRARVKGRASGIVRLLPLRRPFPPRFVEFMPQDFEAGVPRKHCPALGAKP